jgi:hypothetical protein
VAVLGTGASALQAESGGVRMANVPVTLQCSFCGKSQHEVKKLIAGPTV